MGSPSRRTLSPFLRHGARETRFLVKEKVGLLPPPARNERERVRGEGSPLIGSWGVTMLRAHAIGTMPTLLELGNLGFCASLVLGACFLDFLEPPLLGRRHAHGQPDGFRALDEQTRVTPRHSVIDRSAGEARVD